MPGTHVFAQLHREGRITTYDWRLYDAMHAVISPAGMSASQLQDGVAHAYRRWAGGRARRVASSARREACRCAWPEHR